jgi:hypothetical protein
MPGMFESGVDQAHGLRLWSAPRLTRVLPVVESEGAPSSLALCEALETGFSDLGHAVAVVDGVLDLRPEDALLGHGAVLRRWLSGVAPGTVVLLHAPQEALAVLLADSLARPLLPMGADRRSAVAAYQAVKVLLQAGGLQPIVLQPSRIEAAQRARAARALADTCLRHLGLAPVTWSLSYDEADAVRNLLESEPCLLKLLDSALTLQAPLNRSAEDLRGPQPRRTPFEPLSGVADVHGQRHA